MIRGLLLLLILIASISNSFESSDCGQADYNVKYNHFPADLPQAAKYLTRQDGKSGTTRLYAFSPRYAAASRNQTFMTINGGKSWRATAQVLPNINALSSDIPNVLAVASTPVAYRVMHANELWRSDDNGLQWRQISYLINRVRADQFAVKTAQSQHSRCRLFLAALQNADTIFATVSVEVMEPPDYQKIQKTVTLDDLFVSHDGGKSWTLFKAGVANDSPVGISSTNTQLLIAESLGGPIISHDGGRTWQPVGEQDRLMAISHVEGFPDSEQEIADLHRNATETTIMQAGFRRSLEWRKLRVYQFLFDPEDDNVIYLASNKGLFKTRDRGIHWKRLSVGDNHADYLDEVNSVVVDKGVLLVGTSTGIYRSEDGGCNFHISLK